MPTVINLAQLGSGGFAIRGGAAGDNAGISVASAGDINGDGYDDIVIGAPYEDDGGFAAGKAYVVFGKAAGFGTVDLDNLGASGFVIQGDVAGDFAGFSVSSAGDFNGDGYDDILVGAPGMSSSAVPPGAYLLFGKASGFGPIDVTNLSVADGFAIRGYMDSGWSVSSAGDVNGDGFDDVIVGHPGSMWDFGGVYVMFGKAGGFGTFDIPHELYPDDPAVDGFHLLAAPGDRQLGYSVSSAGDINGDGYADLIVGAPQWDVGQTGGKAYVVFGGETFSQGMFMENLTPAQGFVIQAPVSYFAGWSVSEAGDVNGDGYDDLLVGAWASKAAVIFGKASGFGPINLSTLSATDGFIINGVSGDQAGTSVSAAGDVNGDGFADIIVGAPSADGGGADAGNAYVIFGKAGGFGTIDLATLAETDGFVIQGAAAGDQAGTSVSAAGDLNGDGYDDLIVGAPLGDAGGDGAGEAYVVYGFAPTPGVALQGGDGDDVLLGGAGNDALNGAAGNDFLDGGAGADIMTGGIGNDTYVVDEGGDQVIEAAGGGRDVVYAKANYTLAAGSEVEVLSVISQGGGTRIDLTGNELAQELYGNTDSNFLDGGGGADYMAGFGGDDIYVVDSAGDVIAEAAGEGRDVVYARSNYTLNAGAEIEVLSVISQGSGTRIDLTGNALGQELYGNTEANFLDGGGGADYMAGFGGDDIYVVDSAGDVIAEAAGEGRDVVYARASYTLNAGAEVEVLSVISQGGGTIIDLTGNELVNELYGNTESNFLDGGTGADYLQGFGGNDNYVVETQGDVVIEGAGEGNHDVVYARASYALGAGQQIEVLAAQSQAGTGALDLTGNEFANELYGNDGANVLNGGAGGDYLAGYGGADGFAFTTALGGGNVDQIADFLSGTDHIQLDDAVFAGLAPGSLNANAFVIGTSAQDADDRIVYDQASGVLWFDADGNGAGAAVQFATLAGNPLVAASDFTVI